MIIFISQSFISLAETIILNSIQSENVKSKQEIAIENSVNEDEKYLNIILDKNIIDTLLFSVRKILTVLFLIVSRIIRPIL